MITYTIGNAIGTAIVGTVSGTSISFGSETQIEATSNQHVYTSIAFDSTSNKVIYAYSDNTNSTRQVRLGTVSGTSISFGSAVTFESSVGEAIVMYDSVSNRTHIVYNVGGTVGKIITGTVSGISISFGSPVEFANDSAQYSVMDLNSGLDPVSKNVFVLYRKYVASNPDAYKNVIIQPSYLAPPNLTSENFVGIADGAYASGATATIQIVGSVDDAQSGLTPGQSYYVQVDGTLAVTPSTPSVFAGTAVSTTKLIVKG